MLDVSIIVNPAVNHPYICLSKSSICHQCLCRLLFSTGRPWPQRGVRADSQKWVTYKGLAVRTLDARHVKMNHAMQHMAPTVLLVGLLLLAQSDALCPWPTMAPDDKLRHSGFLKLQSEHVEQRCLSGTSPRWQFMLSVELCSLMGLFHRNGLSSFFLWQ